MTVSHEYALLFTSQVGYNLARLEGVGSLDLFPDESGAMVAAARAAAFDATLRADRSSAESWLQEHGFGMEWRDELLVEVANRYIGSPDPTMALDWAAQVSDQRTRELILMQVKAVLEESASPSATD
jgi:hypothetical protein